MLIYVNCNDQNNIKQSKEKIINLLADVYGYNPAENMYENLIQNNDGFLFDINQKSILFRKSRVEGFWKPDQNILNFYKIK